MHNKKLRIIIALMLMLAPPAIMAQTGSSSMNTYTPYTFYGLGDIQPQGTSATRSMGGIGVAYWSPYSINVMNPASYAAVGRNSFLFNFGFSGKQTKLKSSDSKTADNSFNISDVAVQFPLAKGVGFALSVTPFSSVGYEMTRFQNDPDILTEVGIIRYNYEGEGGVTSYKAGVGFQIAHGISLGADFIYYLGTITKYYSQEIIPVMSNDSYRNFTIRNRDEVSRASFGLGLHYDAIREETKMLTFGLTYQPDVKLKNKTTREIGVAGSADSVMYDAVKTRVTIPQKVAAGVYYRTAKLGVGFDFSTQDWKGSFSVPDVDNVSLRSANSYNFGMQYTPNRLDIRSYFKRWTYRAGFRYTDMYLKKNGQNIADMALTMGVGVPVKLGSFSAINVGLEIGQRGKTSHGLVKENYFKISAGFSLFGDDDWFVKRKFF